MVSFSSIDILILIIFFTSILAIGFIPRKEEKGDSAEYLLSGRKVGLFLFVLTNVATWYGGILGVGEFTYKNGLLSWFTQGFPYYIFAIIFALVFADKIRTASLFTIPDKLELTYGKKVGAISSLIIFILVSPAPYILMVGNLIQLVFGIDLLPSLVIATIMSSVYLFRGGYKSYLFTDAIQFFVMFIGFIIIVYIASSEVGGFSFLASNLPETHLSLTGGASPLYVLVWFLIAMWTFADPGFHQRSYAAKNSNVAKYGIIISVFFWFIFDFLTTTTGLYAKAILPDLQNPVLAFPLLAEKILGSGTKGIFYAALFATILSTSNSFLFLSATTFGNDFSRKIFNQKDESKIPFYTRIGVMFSSIIAILLANYFQSVVTLWYLIGSICIPPIILLIFGSYYEKMKVSCTFALIEISVGISGSLIWVYFQNSINNAFVHTIEPMIVGLVLVAIVHLLGMRSRRFFLQDKR